MAPKIGSPPSFLYVSLAFAIVVLVVVLPVTLTNTSSAVIVSIQPPAPTVSTAVFCEFLDNTTLARLLALNESWVRLILDGVRVQSWNISDQGFLLLSEQEESIDLQHLNLSSSDLKICYNITFALHLIPANLVNGTVFPNTSLCAEHCFVDNCLPVRHRHPLAICAITDPDLAECQSECASVCAPNCSFPISNVPCVPTLLDSTCQLPSNDADECLNGTHDCSTDATCNQTDGSFVCTCNQGFSGDGLVCAEINECFEATHNCHASATCTDTAGSFTCACNQGYSGDGVLSCANINECLGGTHNCQALVASCSDTPGSFLCACHVGYSGNGISSCSDVNECVLGTHDCAASAAATCNNTVGSFACTCNAHFSGDGRTCVCETGFSGQVCNNTNECVNATLNNCAPVGSDCTDTIGSFLCACTTGFEGDGVVCADMDECQNETLNNCDAVAGICNNTVGSFFCICNSTGFAGNGTVCTDVDECLEGLHDCSAFASCNNTFGSFVCACNVGYTGDGVSCADRNECTSGTHNCVDATATCTNTPGSFTCACNMGLTCGCAPGFVGPGPSCDCATQLFGVEYRPSSLAQDTDTPSNFSSIDCDTGTDSWIGAVGFNSVTAMDVEPSSGVVYALGFDPADLPFANWKLLTIDPLTGAGTSLGSTDLAFQETVLFDMAFWFNATSGDFRLFAFVLNTTNGDMRFCSIDYAGTLLSSCIGPPPVPHRYDQGGGLAAITLTNGSSYIYGAITHFDSPSETLLLRLDPETGMALTLGLVSFPPSLTGAHINAMKAAPCLAPDALFVDVSYRDLLVGFTNFVGLLNLTTLNVTDTHETIQGLEGLTFLV